MMSRRASPASSRIARTAPARARVRAPARRPEARHGPTRRGAKSPGDRPPARALKVERSIAQGRLDGPPARAAAPRRPATDPIAAARYRSCVVALAALCIYVVSNPARSDYYDHFVWQADAFLEGRAAIRYPVDGRRAVRQRLLPGRPPDPGRRRRRPAAASCPFPPLPALVLLPFVASWAWRPTTQRDRRRSSARSTSRSAGGCSAGCAIRPASAPSATRLLRLRHRRLVRRRCSARPGTSPTSSPRADVPGDRRRRRRPTPGAAGPRANAAAGGPDPDGRRRAVRVRAAARRPPAVRRRVALRPRLHRAPDGRVRRPFFAVRRRRRLVLARGSSAGLGAAIPLALLVAYNVATTGHVFHPAYEYLYRTRAYGYPQPRLPPRLGHRGLRATSPRTSPIAAGSACRTSCRSTPDARHGRRSARPGAARGLFDRECPLVLPRDTSA